jgi:peptide/nickel transport system permease protein
VKKKEKILLWFMVTIVIGAFLAPIIANDRPLVIWNDAKVDFPAIFPKGSHSVHSNGIELKIVYSHYNWKTDTLFRKCFAPIPWSPVKSDALNANYKGPSSIQIGIDTSGERFELKGSEKHLLGTSRRGEDVLAALIHGSRISLLVGFLSMVITGFIGISLGACAGYFGDKGVSVKRSGILISFILFIPYVFYAYQPWSVDFSIMIFIFITMLYVAMIWTVNMINGKLFKTRTSVHLPVDSLISRVIEVLVSVPRLIIIIMLAAIFTPSITSLIIIIGLTSWTEVARLTRAEMLKARELEYMQAARVSGTGTWRQIYRHGLPNVISPALVMLTFGVSSAILTEAGLSFLGIGVPHDTATWGALLAAGKDNINAWWLVVFPGTALFLTVYLFNIVGEILKRRLRN